MTKAIRASGRLRIDGTCFEEMIDAASDAVILLRLTGTGR